jgi:hypothetical protein
MKKYMILASICGICTSIRAMEEIELTPEPEKYETLKHDLKGIIPRSISTSANFPSEEKLPETDNLQELQIDTMQSKNNDLQPAAFATFLREHNILVKEYDLHSLTAGIQQLQVKNPETYTKLTGLLEKQFNATKLTRAKKTNAEMAQVSQELIADLMKILMEQKDSSNFKQKLILALVGGATTIVGVIVSAYFGSQCT